MSFAGPGQDPLAAARCIDRLPLEILLSQRWDFPRHIAFWQRPSRASIALIQAPHLTSGNYRAGLDRRRGLGHHHRRRRRPDA